MTQNPDTLCALEDAARQKLLRYLGLSRRAGACITGSARIRDALGPRRLCRMPKDARIRLILVAADAAERTEDSFRRIDPDVPCIRIPVTGDVLAHAVGEKRAIAAAAILQPQLADAAAQLLRTE